MQLSSENSDDGTAIAAHAQTGYLDCGYPGLKRFYHVIVVTESDTALTVTWETDGVDGTWGSQSGTFTTATGTNPKATTGHLQNAYGRHIRIKVSGEDSDAPWTWYSLNVKWLPEPEAGVHG